MKKKKLELKVYSYQDLQPITLNNVLGGADNSTCCDQNFGCNVFCMCDTQNRSVCNPNTTE